MRDNLEPVTFATFRSRVFLPLAIGLSVLGLVVSIHYWWNGDSWAWRTIAFGLAQLFLLAGGYRPGARLTKTRMFLLTVAISLTLVGWVGIVLRARAGHGDTLTLEKSHPPNHFDSSTDVALNATTLFERDLAGD